MQRKKIISRTLTTAVMLALYIGGVQPSIISAQEYDKAIFGRNDAYQELGIRTDDTSTSTYTYQFADGDLVKLNNNNVGVDFYNERGQKFIFSNGLNLDIANDNSHINGIYTDYEGNLTATNISIKGSAPSYASGIEAYGPNNHITADNLNIILDTNHEESAGANGIVMQSEGEGEETVESTINIKNTTSIKLHSQGGEYGEVWANGIFAQCHINPNNEQLPFVKMNFNKLDITATVESKNNGYARGINTGGYTEVNVKEAHIKTTNNSLTSGESIGINTYANAKVNIGNGSTIHAEGNGDGEIATIGVHACDHSKVNLGITDIKAENNSDGGTIDVLFVHDGAVLNMAGGSITGANNTSDGLFNAINAYGEDADTFLHADTIVNINQGTTNDVVIVGDVRAANTAIVNLNLNTDASSITGNLDQSGPYVDKDDSAGTINLTLANKATWHAMGEYGIGYSYLEKLTLNDGSITMTNEEVQNIDINHLQGTGGKLTLEADANLNTGFFRVNNADTDAAAVHTSYAGINADNVKDAAGLEGLVRNSLKIHDDSAAKFDVHVNEGLLIGQMQADTINHIDGNAIANVKIGQSTTVDAISHLQNAAALSWRQEDATLSKRLGDLRQGDGDQGFWVRLNRGEFKYDNAKNQNNFFQMGYDKAGGDWHYGAAISRNSGKTTYGDATEKNRSLALTLYGTWLGDKGHYADIVLKEGRLSNDYDISAPIGFTHGQYKTWGSSISAEYGREIAMGDKAYFTPQAQLSWLRIAGKDYTTANGIAISQDSQSSTIGRLGFELGSRLGDNGNVYAKASVLHDFGGSADTRLSYNGVSTTYSNDLGDTWYEAGIGFNLKTKDNSYMYADVSKAFGGDYKTSWQWNVGMRWTF